MKTLYVTNGDSTAGTMMQAGFEGKILPWRDVLHEGPVEGRLPLAELSRRRARFLAEKGWAEPEKALADFEARDRTLLAASSFDRVSLWFEHDLYDQLQLLQLLAHFAEHAGANLLDLICIDGYPGKARFRGLGELNAHELSTLRGRERPVTAAQLELARAGFEAFRSDSVLTMQSFLKRDLSALPYLRAALERLLEEFPGRDGLSQSQRQLLSSVQPCSGDLATMFAFCADAEDAPYLGDIVFLDYASALASGRQPALRLSGDDPWTGSGKNRWQRRASLTAFGERLLASEADFVAANGIDRWIGGVHLTSGEWRYDPGAGRVVRR
jgi:hypothetical protein